MSTSRSSTLAGTVGAMGIVYGDIGTSPLYALEQSVKATNLGFSSPVAVLGVLSLMFWALTLVVTVKYVLVMMRADNEGEGGLLALLALVERSVPESFSAKRTLVTLALAGTALFYCDSLITPAISVLSAVEGVELLDPRMERFVLPLTLAILAALFLIQRFGTAGVARLFGPIMLLWFAVLVATGAIAIARAPAVLAAVNPHYAMQLLAVQPALALAILGGVFLAVTGGEALYADMGHFGRRPVRLAWFVLVWPALLINYFGQGALLLSQPGVAEHVLFALVPPVLLPWLIVLATAATVIASQAVISGAFSVTRQATQLDILPRLRVLQTSAREHGQIFIPVVNTLLWLFVSLFVVVFGSSTALAGAYGSAVIGTMVITTLLGAVVARFDWRWSISAVAARFAPLLLVDLAFVAGNATKIDDGGWVPLALSALLFFVFASWRDGRQRLRAALAEMAVPRSQIGSLVQGATRVRGTAVFLVSDPNIVPSAMIRNIEHNHVVHERVIILHALFVRTPRHDAANRVRVEEMQPGIFFVEARYGFMETPNVPEALRACRTSALIVHLAECSFFVGWHLVRSRPQRGLVGLRHRLFAWMQRRSTQAADFFRMPQQGVVMLATRVEI